MKNLLKGTLTVMAAAIALAVLASAAVAATPALSPVPTECTSGCGAEQEFEAGTGGSGSWEDSGGSKWTWLEASAHGSYVAWNEGAELRYLKLTFDNVPCKNEGNNFTTEALRGRFGVVEGKAVVLLRPEGSKIAKCLYSGTSEEVTGSYVAQLSGTPGHLNLVFTGQGLERLTPNEPAHVMSVSIAGGKATTLGWNATITMGMPGRELHVTGRTASLVTPYYAGGFELSGGSMAFASKSGMKNSCTYTSGEGQFTSATGGYVYLRFTNCRGPLNCIASGWESLTRLKAQLAYTYPATETPEGRQVGLVLSPESGGNITELECGKVKYALKGSVIAVISPLAKASSTFALSMKQVGGVEEHTLYEGLGGESVEAKLFTSIEGAKWEQSGVEVKTPTIYLNAGGEETIK